MKVGICGKGWVGKAMKDLFPDAYVYSDGKSGLYGRKEDINKCDVVFIAVPTPNIDESKLDTSIIEEIISWCEADLIVIRSTVNPGDSDAWIRKYKKNIVTQPEYLGETPNHPMLSQMDRQFIVIGGDAKSRRKLINLYATVYNANIKIRQVSNLEAEVIKLSENRAIAFVVAQCQELYDICEMGGVDYYVIRDSVYGDDPRFNLWWSFIYPDKRGFKSKCIPKDVYAFCAYAESLGYSPEVTRAILERNKKWITMI
jgi:UDPglucose 6-dehydrogenase